MVNILLNEKVLGAVHCNDFANIKYIIANKTQLRSSEYYLTQNGKRLTEADAIEQYSNVHCILRTCGGKGGFGSMLRAIGAQIEKTTNREACRDLSGRRLRDINEEKRLRAWLEKQSERERETEERKKRKIEKLLRVPKHEFKDEEYEEARAKLTETVNDAFEAGYKKELEAKKLATETERGINSDGNKIATKRQMTTDKNAVIAKKPKGALWLDPDLSDGSDNSSDESSDYE